MDQDIKTFDDENIKVLNDILSESGYEGLYAWFRKQDVARQEYVLELLGNMIAETINLKAQCNKSMIDAQKPLAEVIPIRRKKPTFTVVK